MSLSKKTHTVVALVALAGLSGLAYWWQHRPEGSVAAAVAPKAGNAGGPTPVEGRAVELLTLTDDAQAVGSLRARQSVLLKPEVSGRVVKLGFSDGQRVRRGQVLIQLDDALQAAQLQQAEAQAGIARTQLQRNRELLAQNFVSASVVDQALAALQVAEAQVALSRAQLARMQVLAPFDGVAGIRNVNLGEYVKDGAELLSVEDASSMWVDFRLPERYVPSLRLGQPVELSLDALPGRSFTARVEALDTQLDVGGRSMLVRARLDSLGSALRSGLFARVRVVFATRERALVVPEEALVPLGGKQYLFKLVDAAGGKQVQRLEARLGLRVPGKVEVLDGFKAGDWVVTAGQSRLTRGENQAVKLVDVDKQGGTAANAAASAASR
ncbi:efflux RND transporter periplasmic adaptor subunit [Paucibacter soli]|uniref:efflux RND transporter periplasmic adaptor subunit n=1 Tax=Paucibacter soli TaxID=3133433 RepID=UPI0030996C15